MLQHIGQLVLQNSFPDSITMFQKKVEGLVLTKEMDVLVSKWMEILLLFDQVHEVCWGHMAEEGLGQLDNYDYTVPGALQC
jgi:hypothetical protein